MADPPYNPIVFNNFYTFVLAKLLAALIWPLILLFVVLFIWLICRYSWSLLVLCCYFPILILGFVRIFSGIGKFLLVGFVRKVRLLFGRGGGPGTGEGVGGGGGGGRGRGAVRGVGRAGRGAGRRGRRGGHR